MYKFDKLLVIIVPSLLLVWTAVMIMLSIL